MNKTRRGRPNEADRARNAIIASSFLSRYRMEINSTTLARLLGLPSVSAETNATLILAMHFLDIARDNFSRMSASESTAMTGPVRLTVNEALALTKAIEKTGGIGDEELERLKGAWWPLTADWEDLDGMANTERVAEPDVVTYCNAACRKRRDLAFSYTKVDGSATQRHVTPLELRQGGEWILDAYDHGEHDIRHFRLDRMSRVIDAGASDPDIRNLASHDENETVRLMFSSTTWLDLFDWPDLQLDDEPQEGFEASGTIPYFGQSSTFLPAQIAATAGGVSCDNEEVTRAAHAWIEDLRREAP